MVGGGGGGLEPDGGGKAGLLKYLFSGLGESGTTPGVSPRRDFPVSTWSGPGVGDGGGGGGLVLEGGGGGGLVPDGGGGEGFPWRP